MTVVLFVIIDETANFKGLNFFFKGYIFKGAKLKLTLRLPTIPGFLTRITELDANISHTSSSSNL